MMKLKNGGIIKITTKGESMTPKKIRVTKNNRSPFLRTGEIYDVLNFHCDTNEVMIESDNNCHSLLKSDEWEPVQDFKHGDPVWAWDYTKECGEEGFYIGKSIHLDFSPHVVEYNGLFDSFIHVEHRKPTITIKELAEKAGIDLDEYELITCEE